MALRTRLSLAFVLVVLIPVVVGAIIVAVVAPQVLHDQVSGRLRTARTSVAEVIAGRCSQATQAAQILGLDVAALGPQEAVKRVVSDSMVDYAVVEDATGNAVAAAGSLPGAPTTRPLPAVLNSCGTATNAGFAISARAQLAIADQPTLKDVAVAWSVDAKTSSALSADIDGSPAVTLIADGRVVSSTLPAATASKEAVDVQNRATGVADVGSRIAAFGPAGAGQPYGIIVSEPQPSTAKFSWLLVAVVVVTVACALVFGRLLARLISRPVIELSEAATRVAGGEFDIAIPVRSRDEVGRLGDAFNHMTGELRTYIGELEQSRDELRRNLDRLGATLTHTHDLGGILAVVLDTAIGSVQATGGAIMFIGSDNSLTVKLRRGAAAEAMPADVTLPLGKGITGMVAKTGEPVRGVVGDGPGLRPVPHEPQAKTVIAVPLKQSGRIVGVLNLYDKEGGRQFSGHDLDTILAFASQASVAIDNVLLHQEAQRLSLTDPLTSLWNYRYLTIGLGHEIERATRFSRPLAVLMLDLDRFKLINDQHGHQIGDAVLVEMAARMRVEVREVDTLARYGGEEFVVVLPETDAAGAARAADRLRDSIGSAPFCEGTSHSLAVTASIGVAVFPEHGTTASRLLRSADDALYVAKDSGRDCWRFATAVGEEAPEVALDDDAAINLATVNTGGIGADEAAVRAFDETSPLAKADEIEAARESAETGPPAHVVMPDAEPAPRQSRQPQVPDR
ncbi:MAG: diguanylate cyclase [Acidothermaceae bacterium]